jgi:hypothetical protein
VFELTPEPPVRPLKPSDSDNAPCDYVDCPCRTSLDAIETRARDRSGDPLLPYSKPVLLTDRRETPPLSPGIAFRHSGWLHLRSRVLRALVATNQSTARRVSFACCGAIYYVMESVEAPGTYRLAANACHDRFCLPCATERSRTIAWNLRAYLGAQPCRFITLTVRSSREPLQELLTKLYSSFQKLRRDPLWAKTQTGGIAFLEVKWSSRTERWHPHLHVIAQGASMQQEALARAWHRCTGDSHIVDIRAVKDPGIVLGYVTKYASKPFDGSMLRNQPRLEEAVVALRSRRLVICFGAWRRLKVTSKPDPTKWKPIGTVNEFTRRALDGDHAAARLLADLLGERANDFLVHALRARNAPVPPDTPIAPTYFVSPLTGEYW